MKAFRLKDKISGLYYIPLRKIRVKQNGLIAYVKSNLSKKGKIYYSDCRKHISTIEDHTLCKLTSGYGGFSEIVNVCRPFKEEEWEMEFLN